jgi:hypothetical protein
MMIKTNQIDAFIGVRCDPWPALPLQVLKLHILSRNLGLKSIFCSIFKLLCRDLVEGLISVNTNGNDNGGRRKKSDRRQFSYTFHIPERRTGLDRRDGDDRRKSMREIGSLLLVPS